MPANSDPKAERHLFPGILITMATRCQEVAAAVHGAQATLQQIRNAVEYIAAGTEKKKDSRPGYAKAARKAIGRKSAKYGGAGGAKTKSKNMKKNKKKKVARTPASATYVTGAPTP
jgi:hypothetical protein